MRNRAIFGIFSSVDPEGGLINHGQSSADCPCRLVRILRLRLRLHSAQEDLSQSKRPATLAGLHTIMKFIFEKKLKSGVRVGKIETAHGIIYTPFFMPVATAGSVKSVSPDELNDLGAEVVLSNTYHLYLRPGEKNIKKLGGLHKFMNWNGPILTDSGGYQVFSLGKNNFQLPISNDQLKKNEKLIENCKLKIENSRQSLVKVMDDGVEFTSHIDGSKHFFTPEKVIQIQLDLGVDILMPLDYCPSGKSSPKEVKRSVDITIAWAKRSKKYFDKKIAQLFDCPIVNSESNEAMKQCNNKQAMPALFGIVQGGLDPDLRKYCAEKLIALNFDGYSVGGLAVDHETRDMWQTVKLMGKILPENKPRYLMGVGTPDDIIKATALGMDMFDCVLPTRLARHGSIYVKCQMSNVKTSTQNYKLINLLNSKYRSDMNVIDKNCECYACQKGGGFTRAYISHLIRENEIFGLRLATLHNLYQYLNLMRTIRKSA